MLLISCCSLHRFCPIEVIAEIYFMIQKENLICKKKISVLALEPIATLILYGSYARGNNRPDSDIQEEIAKLIEPARQLIFQIENLVR
ncbi:MAG: nucleotidyltransferase domain-containing protein [Ginsengibacter sp.]